MTCKKYYILKEFQKIYFKIKEVPDTKEEFDKSIEAAFKRVFKFVFKDINTITDCGFRIAWLNFWCQKTNRSYFSGIDENKFCDISIQNNKEKIESGKTPISPEIYHFKKEDYKKYILSSRILLQSINQDYAFLVIKKISGSELSNVLNIQIENVNTFKSIFEKSNGFLDLSKYKKSLKIIKESYNSNIKTLLGDTSEFFSEFKIRDNDKFKFVNWIYWLINLYPNQKWEISVYLNGADVFGKKALFHENDFLNCNIGIDEVNNQQNMKVFVDQVHHFVSRVSNYIRIFEKEQQIRKQLSKTAIISILVDSYAHNISAHSLAALKWWFEKRTVEYDKRIYIGKDKDKVRIACLENLEPREITFAQLKTIAEMSDKYNEIIGLNDSSNDENYTSLMEIIKLFDREHEKPLLTYKGQTDKDKAVNYRYPIPIDFAVSKFMRFLRDKAAFWSGVTRDLPFGGEVKNLYDILWNDFADNPLYLGTIAHSEEIDKLNINIEFPVRNFKDENGDFLDEYSSLEDHKTNSDFGNIEYIKLDFAKIDMSVMDYEKELYQNAKLNGCENKSVTYPSKFYMGDIKSDFVKKLQNANDDDHMSKYLISELENDCDLNERSTESLQNQIISKLNKLIRKEQLWTKGRNEIELSEETKKLISENSVKGKELIRTNRKVLEDYYPEEIVKLPKTINYSKYALFYPGKDHREIREELQKDNYNVFLPGGVVGEHALFTIFENTIRNIKHYNVNQKMKEEGLNFVIRITPAKLMPKSDNDLYTNLGSEDHKLFSISVYLDHDNRQVDSKFEDIKPKFKRRKEILEKQTSKSVIDDKGSPRLGGNAQDKICAAMLLNNQFISVDSNLKQEISERDKYYHNKGRKFYWIGFEDTLDVEKVEGIKKMLIKLKHEYKGELEKKSNDEIEILLDKYSLSCKRENKNKKITALSEPYFNEKVDEILNSEENKGKLKKHFHLWKGDIIKELKDLKDLHVDNLARFKFVYLDEKIKNRFFNHLKSKEDTELIKQRPIRIITKNDLPDTCNFSDYMNDIENEVKEKSKGEDNENPEHIIRNEIVNERFYKIWIDKSLAELAYNVDIVKGESKDPVLMINKDKKLCFSIPNNNNRTIRFAHGDNTNPNEILNYRSHGILQKRYLKKKDRFDDFNFKSEFVEIITKRIKVIDNRIYDRCDYTLRHKLKSKLMLEMMREKDKPFDSEEFVEDLNKAITIIHLSFIESYTEYSEENISEFIRNELNIKEDTDITKFLLVITTGRGRFSWIKNLEPQHRMFTIFRPIESLLSAVEDGVLFNDDFQIKYNLLKVIYGS